MPTAQKVFISHAYPDSAFAQELATYLRKAGVDVWLDVAHPEGGDIVQAMGRALSERDILVLLLTPTALQSRWVGLEMSAAIIRFQQGLMHAPIIVKTPDVPAASIPALWAPFKYIDFSADDYDAIYDKVLRSLRASATQHLQPVVQHSASTSGSFTRTPGNNSRPSGEDKTTRPLNRPRPIRTIIVASLVALVIVTASGVFVDRLVLSHSSKNPKPQLLAQSLPLQWKFQTGGPVGELNIWNGVLYAGSSDANLYALNTETGSLDKRIHLDGPIARPPINDGTAQYVLTTTGTLYALSPVGAVVWQQETKADGRHGIGIANGRAYVPTRGNLEVRSTKEGALIQTIGDLGVVGDFALDKGKLYAGSGNTYVYAIDAMTGSILWKFQMGDSVTGAVAVDGTTVFVGSADHYLYAIDTTTGMLRWRFQTGGKILGRPLVADGILYVGSTDHKLYALDPNAGVLRWSYLTAGSVVEKPYYHNGILYVGSTDRSLYALDALTGAFRGRFQTDGAVSSPLIYSGLLYIGSADGYVYALQYS